MPEEGRNGAGGGGRDGGGRGWVERGVAGWRGAGRGSGWNVTLIVISFRVESFQGTRYLTSNV